MITKFGKLFDMEDIGRNISGIKHAIDKHRKDADKYYLQSSNGGCKCRICGGLSNRLFLTAYDKYKYNECLDCGCVFLDNLPDIYKMYNPDTESSANSVSYVDETIYKKRIDMITKPKVDFVMECLGEESINIKKWLDIGCGGGEILSYINAAYPSVTVEGIESDYNEFCFVRSKGLNVYNLYIDLENENEEVLQHIKEAGVISLINVIEHIETPILFIEYLYNHMKKGSVLVFEVPRHPSVASFANLAMPNDIYRHIVPPIHLQVFSNKGIDLLLNGRFEVVGRWEFGQGYSDVINSLMLLSGMEENELYFEIMKKSNEIQKAIDQQGLGDSVLLVAKKR